MHLLPLTLLIAAWFGVVPREVDVDPLILHAREASVRIGARPSGVSTSYGPAVTFEILAKFDCPGEAIAESIVFSIADTLARHIPAAGENSLTASLVVPGDQVVPADAGEFCVGEKARSEDVLLLPHAATASVSLRCRDDSNAYMRFASIAMPLRLICEPATTQDGSGVVLR